MVTLGVIFPPSQPPERLRPVATAADQADLDELWVWEDCFAESGAATAAAALAWTERIHVGIGIMPVPLRNVALTAMEVATLARLFPGRVHPGIGHGVLDWMGQVGARAGSPLRLLREYGTALRRLLDGETVTTRGGYVTLDEVRLAWPPSPPPPLLVGATRAKTLALAGEVADGVIFGGGTTAEQLGRGIQVATEARARAGLDGSFDVVTFLDVPSSASADEIAALARDHAAAGATRIAVVGLGDGGTPDGSERLLDLVPTLRQARVQLG